MQDLPWQLMLSQDGRKLQAQLLTLKVSSMRSIALLFFELPLKLISKQRDSFQNPYIASSF